MLAETLESLELARGLCEKFGNDALRCDVLSALAFCTQTGSNLRRSANATCEELLEIGTQMNDTDMIGSGAVLAGFHSLWRGEFHDGVGKA